MLFMKTSGGFFQGVFVVVVCVCGACGRCTAGGRDGSPNTVGKLGVWGWMGRRRFYRPRFLRAFRSSKINHGEFAALHNHLIKGQESSFDSPFELVL